MEDSEIDRDAFLAPRAPSARFPLRQFGLGPLCGTAFAASVCPARTLPPLYARGFSQHEIFEGKRCFACRERSAAAPTGDFPISGLRSGFYFDNLIKRFAVLTKIRCGRHKTPHTNQCVPAKECGAIALRFENAQSKQCPSVSCLSVPGDHRRSWIDLTGSGQHIRRNL